MVHEDAFTLQKNMNATIPEPAPLVGQLAQPFSEWLVAVLLILKDRSIQIR